MSDPKPSRAEAAAKLRADLKEQGLEHAVRLMTVPERGDARRLIREALACLIESLEVDGESAERMADLAKRDRYLVRPDACPLQNPESRCLYPRCACSWPRRTL